MGDREQFNFGMSAEVFRVSLVEEDHGVPVSAKMLMIEKEWTWDQLTEAIEKKTGLRAFRLCDRSGTEYESVKEMLEGDELVISTPDSQQSFGMHENGLTLNVPGRDVSQGVDEAVSLSNRSQVSTAWAGSTNGGASNRYQERRHSKHKARPKKQDDPQSAGRIILLANSIYSQVWVIIVLLTLMYFAFILPFRAVFRPNYLIGLTESWLFAEFVLDGILFLDILLKFFTSYAGRGGLPITDYHLIAKHYIKSWFVVDFYSQIPFELLALPVILFFLRLDGLWLISVLRMNRLIRLLPTIRRILDLQGELSVSFGTLRIANFLVALVVVTHWIACGWWMLALIQGFPSNSWAYPYQNLGLFSRYIRSLYWTVTTMATVGYGDIVPLNNFEICYAMCVMVTGVSVYGYILGSLASLLAQNDQKSASYREKVEIVNNYMKFQHVPSHLQKRVNSYYTYMWKRNRGFDEKSMLIDIPSGIRTEISLYIHRDILSRVPLFQEADPYFLREIASLLHPIVFAPGEDVTVLGDIGACMYFVNYGRLRVLSPVDEKVCLAELKRGDFFGELALIFEMPRTATVRCTTHVDLYVLTKSDVDQVFVTFPEVYTHFRAKAEERLKAINLSQGRTTRMPSISQTQPAEVDFRRPSLISSEEDEDSRRCSDSSVQSSSPKTPAADLLQNVA